MDREVTSLDQVADHEDRLLAASPVEETLVADVRADLTPSQMVERKLENLLQSVPLPVKPLHRVSFRGPSYKP
jgi:hypothetical protein